MGTRARVVAVALCALVAVPARSDDRGREPGTTGYWLALQYSTNAADQRLVSYVKSLDTIDACFKWGEQERSGKLGRITDAIRSRLVSDRMLNEIDYANVRKHGVAIGMTVCGMYATIGMASKVNVTVTKAGRFGQYIYQDRGLYVYTEPSQDYLLGVVSSYQLN